MTRIGTNLTTGVEKGEDEEHHLQAALVSRNEVVIPTPDASALASQPNYEKYYSPTFELPKSLIKFSALAEEQVGCLYNLTDDDLKWLDGLQVEMRSRIPDNEFEKAVFLLDKAGDEKVSGQAPELEECIKVVESNEALKPQLEQDCFECIYEYWKLVRYQKKKGKSMRPILKSEDMSSNPDNDPYVCFRIREIKNTRKIRRSDTQGMQKLQRLKQDMVYVKQLLELIAQREVARKELLEMEKLVFEKRVQVRRLKKYLGINTADTLDASPEKTRKRVRLDGESSKIRIPLDRLRDAVNIYTDIDSQLLEDVKTLSSDQKIEEHIKREKAIQEKSGWLDCTEFPFTPHPSSTFWGSHLGIESRSGPHVSSRRRMGRGGRIVFDRHIQYNRDSIDSRLQDPLELPQIVPDTIHFTLNKAVKESQVLYNKPAHPFTFDPTQPVPIPQPPADVIRAPPQSATAGPAATAAASSTGSAAPKKRPPKVSADKTSGIPTPNKTKAKQEIQANNVKDMLKKAQLQAQQQAQQQAELSRNPSFASSAQASPLAFASNTGISATAGASGANPNFRPPSQGSNLSQMLMPQGVPTQAGAAPMGLLNGGAMALQPPAQGGPQIMLSSDGTIRMRQGDGGAGQANGSAGDQDAMMVSAESAGESATSVSVA
ncbi:Enhancer of polycomb-like protein 1 [Kappamyces sp. JEL0829]|nr:Enhancer of polycomb-like protein 1 [Kappamyces sp. JEL0829]